MLIKIPTSHFRDCLQINWHLSPPKGQFITYVIVCYFNGFSWDPGIVLTLKELDMCKS